MRKLDIVQVRLFAPIWISRNRVSMGDVVGLRECGVGIVVEQLKGFFYRHRFQAVDQLMERNAVNELHDEIVHTILLADTKHRNDVGVVQVRGRLGFVAEALKTALVPQIETTKAVGIVFLPGMMVGLLLAGVTPLDAVQAQLVIMYLVLGSVAVSSSVSSRSAAAGYGIPATTWCRSVRRCVSCCNMPVRSPAHRN